MLEKGGVFHLDQGGKGFPESWRIGVLQCATTNLLRTFES